MREKFRKWLISAMIGCTLCILALGASDRQAAAQGANETFTPVRNWLPDDFQIACGPKDGPYRPDPRDISCIGFGPLLAYQANAWTAVQDFKAAGFVSPYNFGPVIDQYEGEGRVVRIFSDVTKRRTLAHVAPKPSPQSSTRCSREGYRFMAVNPSALTGYPSYAIGLVAAHELFHAVQMAVPGELKENKHRWGGGAIGCFRPKWIMESQADTVAIDYTRRQFPSRFPPRPRQRFGANMAGLRPYYIPLNYNHSLTDYDTNSFWLYLGNYFHDREFKFLQDYAKVPPPVYGDDKEDWLRWLDERLRADDRIDTPLYLIYPGFLTHFAGEWAAGGIGRRFGRSKWLTRAFGGCQSVTVSPQAPYAEIDVGLHKVAGKCLSVTITGIDPAELVSIKIGALTERLEIADSLHLGLAFTNDQTGFNCAQQARRYRPRPGLAGCLFEPVTGLLETATSSLPAGRIWHASSVEMGPGAKQSKGGTGGDIENVYVLSYVPTKPWEEKLEGKPPITVKIGVGLEGSALSVAGEDVNQGSVDGTRTATRRRAVAARGVAALEADMSVPHSTGWIDDQGMAKVVGGGIWDIIAETRKMGSEMAAQVDPAATLQGIMLFRLAEARIEPLGGAPSEDRIEPLRTFGVTPVEPLPKGATGNFPAMISGGDPRTRITYVTPEDQPASLTVLENSESAFRATVDGVVCAMAAEEMTERIGGVVRSVLGDRPRRLTEGDLARLEAGFAPIERHFAQSCDNRIRVSGSISKPFASLYHPGTQLVSEETEGEKLYNQYGPPRLMRERLAGAAGGGGAGGGAGGGGGAGDIAAGCACQCPELAIPDTPACRAQCRPEWAICKPAVEPPKPPKPTVEAQVRYLRRLIGGQGLAPEVEEMLVEDFAEMSDDTRAYLIRQYRNGVQ